MNNLYQTDFLFYMLHLRRSFALEYHMMSKNRVYLIDLLCMMIRKNFWEVFKKILYR